MFFKKKIIEKYRKKLAGIKSKNKEKLFQQKQEFSGILNHSIKTVLLAHCNCLELFLKGKFGKISNNQKEILNEILSSNKFLVEIINNTIFLADMDEKTSCLNFENINMIDETMFCLKNIQKFAKIKNQNLIFRHFGKNVNLSADKKLLEKIIYNIIVGCVSYGFEESDIVVSIEENEKEIFFNAKNKSIFMTKEKLNDIFENNKSNNDFNQLGMKLNLNIAKQLVKIHHWDFVAQSDKNDNSSTFGFVIKKPAKV